MLYLVKTITKIIIIFFAAIAFASSVSNAFSTDKNVIRDGVVTAFRLNVRDEPSNESKVNYILKAGAKIKIHGDIEKFGSWIQIEFDREKGYVRNRTEYIRLIKTIKTKTDFEKADFKKTIVKKTTPEAIPSIEDDKKSITKKIKQKQDKIISFSKEEKIIIEGLNEIDSTLNIARVRVSHISDSLNKLDSKIRYIVEEKEKISQEYDQKRIYSGTRLNALYRMRMLGKFEIVSEPDSIFDFIIQQRALGKIIESDLKILDEQIITMQRFENLENELKQKKQEKLELERELNQQILITEQKSKRKNEILKKIRTEKEFALAAVRSLQKAAQKLEKQIEQIKKLEFIKINSRSFFDYQGRLSMPVKGKIISKFGTEQSSDNKTFTFQKGIDIKPLKNESVKAVFYGKVIFSKWFQGYGNLMIIDHGDSYYSLYAHNKELLKKMGELVEKGENIAIAGDTGSIKGLCLHFEIRHHGKPVNPMKWLKKGA
ncbi:MAG: peptidoglycan DD-metalloendopeptidase family protein [Desulfobacteraceae bacterium]|nr:peptidoglycan DD-metalloendopeptidase family protein [Desulfobacteraceae bacterium]